MLDEAVATTGADSWLASGTGGSGVQVAIVDIGFGGWKAQQAAGELPGERDDRRRLRAGSFEGEITAPRSPRSCTTWRPPPSSPSSASTRWRASARRRTTSIGKGIPIVNHSVGWFNTSRGDGRGPRRRRRGSSRTRAPTACSGSTRPATRPSITGRARSPTRTRTAGTTSARAARSRRSTRATASSWTRTSRSARTSSGTTGPRRRRTTTSTSTGSRRRTPNGQPADKPKLVASSTNLQSGTQSPTESVCYTNPSNEHQGLRHRDPPRQRDRHAALRPLHHGRAAAVQRAFRQPARAGARRRTRSPSAPRAGSTGASSRTRRRARPSTAAPSLT